jgi:atypical dual specificity phosphatase
MLRNFSYVVEDQIAACAHPDYSGDCSESLEELKERGIGALVSLDECGIPLHEIADHDFHYLHLAVPDFTPPTIDQVRQFLDFVERERTEGRRVAVHCGAGYGRTGTMLACYFVAQGDSPEKAVRKVRESRPGSIETTEQEKFVCDFAAEIAPRKGRKLRRSRRKTR